MIPKVRVHGVSKTFRIGASPGGLVRALEQVSFTVRPGEVLALTGLSGCGKTTLLRIIMGLEAPTSGTVEVDGRPVAGCGFDRAMVFQRAELLPWRTAVGNVEFGLEVKGIPSAERRRTALEKLELVGLSDATGRRPNELSGGMQQRVGLARAIAVDPQVLLMDEPFGALDAMTRESLQVELLSIHEKTGKTIIFVTHDLDEAVLLADRVVLMSTRPGRVKEIIEVGIPRETRKDLALVRGSREFADLRFYLWRGLRGAATDSAPRATESGGAVA